MTLKAAQNFTANSPLMHPQDGQRLEQMAQLLMRLSRLEDPIERLLARARREAAAGEGQPFPARIASVESVNANQSRYEIVEVARGWDAENEVITYADREGGITGWATSPLETIEPDNLENACESEAGVLERRPLGANWLVECQRVVVEGVSRFEILGLLGVINACVNCNPEQTTTPGSTTAGSTTEPGSTTEASTTEEPSTTAEPSTTDEPSTATATSTTEPPTGACCLLNGECIDGVTEGACTFYYQGVWHENRTCDEPGICDTTTQVATGGTATGTTGTSGSTIATQTAPGVTTVGPTAT